MNKVVKQIKAMAILIIEGMVVTTTTIEVLEFITTIMEVLVTEIMMKRYQIPAIQVTKARVVDVAKEGMINLTLNVIRITNLVIIQESSNTRKIIIIVYKKKKMMKIIFF